MRISNLILQGVIAGAILFIPTNVFADKGQSENRNPVAEQNDHSGIKYENAVKKKPEQKGSNAYVRKTKSSNYKTKENRVKDHTSNVSNEKREERRSDSNAGNHPKAKHYNREEKQVPHRHYTKSVPLKQPVNKKAETSKLIHIDKPLAKTEVMKPLAGKENKKNSVDSFSKKNDKKSEMKSRGKIPKELPLQKIPEYPASKVMLVTSGQSSSHSSSTNDGGNGASTTANFKASLSLPVLFNLGEMVSVYFSRMDLLRSQWVNAPPAPPPKTAL